MVKIKDVTPGVFMCLIGGCPSVFETDDGTLLVVGKKPTGAKQRLIPRERIGDGELVVEVPRGLLADLKLTADQA